MLSKLGVNAPPLSQSICGSGESDPSAATVDPCLLFVAKLCPGFALKQALRQRKRKTPAQHISMQPAIKSTVSLEKANTSPFTHCVDCTPICEAVGSLDGLVVGDIEGNCVGFFVGKLVGDVVGEAGAVVGSADGCRLGFDVG